MRKRLLLTLAVLVLPVTAACGADDSSAVNDPVAEGPAATTVPPKQGVDVTVYFVQEGRLVPATRSVDGAGGDQAIAGAAMRALLAGPAAGEQAGGFRSEIPDETRLLGVKIGPDAVATVDLSREFEAGGDSAGIRARLGQVVCTLDNVTEVDSVDGTRFLLGGKQAKVFSSEGISLDNPLSCTDFDGLFR